MKAAEIAQLLPEVFRSVAPPGSVLATLLAVMSRQHERTEQLLDGLDTVFDPRRTDDRFVPMLAHWVDLGRLLSHSGEGATGETLATGTGRLRELVAHAAELSQWRGTRRGLLAFLEIATGAPGFRIEEQVPGSDGRLRPFHLRVVAPPGLADRQRMLAERIVAFEKPAYATCDIVFTPNE